MQRARRARGAVIVEFALVGPIFILMMVAVFQVSVWAWDRESLAITARQAARAAVIGQAGGFGTDPGAAEVSRILASRVEIVTPALPAAVSAGVFPPTATWSSCLRSRNAPGSAVLAGRLGWDWTCQRDSTSLATAPLTTAIDTAISLLHGEKGIWLGPHGTTEITACYIAITSTGGELCVYSMRATVSADGAELAGLATSLITNARTAPAPSLIAVSMRSSAPTVFGPDLLGIAGVGLEASGAAWIDRFRPPCPPPTAAADYAPGRCGGVH